MEDRESYFSTRFFAKTNRIKLHEASSLEELAIIFNASHFTFSLKQKDVKDEHRARRTKKNFVLYDRPSSDAFHPTDPEKTQSTQKNQKI